MHNVTRDERQIIGSGRDRKGLEHLLRYLSTPRQPRPSSTPNSFLAPPTDSTLPHPGAGVEEGADISSLSQFLFLWLSSFSLTKMNGVFWLIVEGAVYHSRKSGQLGFEAANHAAPTDGKWRRTDVGP